MYFGWFVFIFVVWAWFTGGSIYGWRERTVGPWITLGSVAVWTGIALLIVLFAMPYWQVIFWTLIQPG